MTLSRSIFRWLLFGACVAVFLAAMLWVTQRMLAMEQQRLVNEREAQVQERLRLALWRMDSQVNALLIRENSRPANHYQSFHAPDDLYSNRSQKELPKGEAVMPSPLLAETPEFVQLHFQLGSSNGTPQCTSPQAPVGKDLELANNWYAISPQIQTARQQLDRLNQLLQKHPGILLPATAAKEQLDTKAASSVSVNNAPMEADKALPLEKFSLSQQIANNAERLTRAKVASDSAQDKLAYNALPKKKQEEAAKAPAAVPAPAGAKAITRSPTATTLDDNEVRQEAARPNAPIITPVSQEVPTDLKPLWLENELLLIRTASINQQSRMQGLWLDWALLRSRLLENIRDLLPNAQLVATDAALQDASSLVTLPVRLLPGVLTLSISETSPLHRSLVIAWSCFLIAAAAVGIVLHRAILLSERRGAFVSAVTHELRTPLTTFQLYSEMLADDMVPDAEKRHEYLRTLCDESTRLTHLVENVLSYSRIERGRTAARREHVRLADFINRIEPRLRLRAQQVELDLQVHAAPEASDVVVHIDALAVEQIVFNLVDNACKYAAPDCTERTLQVEASATPRLAVIRVRDHGPGLSKQQLKRLFHPFEKSATEAAHSAPGVGLGLALCRRLARELGGDLVLESNDRGACFKLTVPRSLS